MKRLMILAAAATLCSAAQAQQLQTEVTVDRTVDHRVDDAARPKGLVPAIVTPKVQTPKLSTAEYTAPGTLTSEICPMPPARWADTVPETPYRGYASIGYLPAYNLGANAGYRFAHTPTLDAGVWMQYCGTSYKGPGGKHDASFTNHFLSVGADGTWHPNSESWLEAGISFSPSAVERPMAYGNLPNYRQTASAFDINALWRSRAQNVKYHVGAAFERFWMGTPKTLPEGAQLLPPVSQGLTTVQGGAALCESGSDIPWLGLDADWNILYTNDYHLGIAPELGEHYGYKTLQEVGIRPYVSFDIDKVHLRAGFNLNVGIGGDDAATHIAPEVQATYTPAAAVTVYAKLSGGEYLNPMHKLYITDPYLAYNTPATTRSRVPARIDGGVNILPFDALRLGFSAGYAGVRGATMPVIAYNGGSREYSTFDLADFDAWYAGAEISYTFRTFASATVHAKTAKANKGAFSWIDWADCARHEIGASLHITPTPRLDIDVDLCERIQRRSLAIAAPSLASTAEGATAAHVSLGSSRLLGAGAAYRITDAVTAFLRLDNLLGSRYLLVGGIPAQRMHGMVGAAVKF